MPPHEGENPHQVAAISIREYYLKGKLRNFNKRKDKVYIALQMKSKNTFKFKQ